MPTSHDSCHFDDFDALVRAIYHGPMETPPWQGFVCLLNTRLDGAHTVLMLRPPTAERASLMVISGPVADRGTDSYDGRFHAFDPFCNLPPLQVVLTSDILSEQRWFDSVIYREFLKPHDIRVVLGADLPPDGGDASHADSCRLRITRGHAQPDFDNAERALVQRLLPHLAQALRLRARMASMQRDQQLLAGTLERMQLGTLTLDSQGRVLTLNAQAQAVLDEGDGLRLLAGHLQAVLAEEQRALTALLAGALGEGRAATGIAMVEAISISRRSGRSKLSLLVRAIPPQDWAQDQTQPCVALFVRDPEQFAPGAAELLRRLYALTRAESELTLLLAQGLTLEDVAERLDVRRNTVRAHLRAIFSKMGVTRLTEMVRLVLTSVAPLG